MATAPDSVSCFPVPALSEVPDDIRDRMLAVQEKAGFVPNVFLLLARRPAEFRAFVAYHDALMDKREGLTLAERDQHPAQREAAADQHGEGGRADVLPRHRRQPRPGIGRGGAKDH